jgi:hypothetical protein
VLLKDGTVTAGGRTIAVPVDAPALADLATATYTAESGEELADVYADIGGRVA